MRGGSCGDKRQYAYTRVRIPLPRLDKLAQRAAAYQHGAETDKGHAQKIPQRLRVRDGLPGKPGLELPYRKAADKSSGDYHYVTGKGPAFLEQKKVPEAAGDAKIALMTEGAYDERRDQRYDPGRVHGTGSLNAEFDEGRPRNKEHEQKERKNRHGGSVEAGVYREALAGIGFHGTRVFKTEAFFQGKCAKPRTGEKPRKTDKGVKIARPDAKRQAQGAAQKHKAACHDEKRDSKPDERTGRNLDGLPVASRKGKQKSTEYEAGYFRPHVLNRRRPVQSQRPRRIAEKTSGANPHVGGIPQRHKRYRRSAYHYPGYDKPNPIGFN
jgi:hypothetical protein